MLAHTAAPVALALPADAGLSDTGRAILTAAAGGNLPPDIASQLIAAVGALARVVEMDELERRIAQLEGVKNGKS
ncbi:MAG: hypothetical protein Q8N54_16740 [Sulfurimicrobium sp.]|nr:hypothetical protein [Sulfurimicrobium sp.]MDP1703993.1 hypothetical protein [Sulfurimicrobium sp.]MDP2199252.1 hypothetical protein [Sulfurimicrobium sp.]MDP2964398.1 hypothetical protein [Sulfurimicrobium sp.]MDP3688911.1 hypothetical protein [Sulfurimicrobium sp.]